MCASACRCARASSSRTMRRSSSSSRPEATSIMQGFPRGRSAIVGAATFGIGRSPGLEAIDLAAHASLAALADAGLRPADVDALFIAQPQDTLASLSFSEYLGLDTRLTDNNR